MNYFIAGLIIAIWIGMVCLTSWDLRATIWHNLAVIMMFVIFLGLVHWLPFWLIFFS